MWFGLIHHVTMVLIVAFFVLFTASKAQGLVKLLGNLLGLLLLVFAVLAIAAAVTAPMFGGKPFGMDMHGMHGGWMHHDGGPGTMGQPGMQPGAPSPDHH